MAAPEKYRKMFGKSRADAIYKRGLGAFYRLVVKGVCLRMPGSVARLKAHAKGKATVKKSRRRFI